MSEEHQIVSVVYAAKEDVERAEAMLRDYMPFIRSEASKCLSRFCTDQDDALSIAMMAFHEAILGYDKSRGAFLSYAALRIRSRIIDWQRKEARHQGQISLDTAADEEAQPLREQLADERDHFEESVSRQATRQEIAELAAVMADFGVSFSDVAAHSPKQARTLEACGVVVRYARDNEVLLDELLRTKKLPLAALVRGTGVERKTLERHRKYILAMLLILTNGYEIIRGHLNHVLNEKGGHLA